MTRPLRPTRASRLSRPERREQLLLAARDVFVANGYHAAAMDDIAERAGVSKPVLYQHFPGKLELYLALLDTHIDALVARMRATLASTTDNRMRVHGAISTYFDFVDADGGAFRLVFESDLRNVPQVRQRVQAGVTACVEAIADSIAADTGAPLEHAHLLSVSLTGLAEVSARWWLDRQGDLDEGSVGKQDAVELLSGLAWRGISSFPRQDDTGSPTA